MLGIREVRIDTMIDPIGISKMPCFSWKIESDRKHVRQRAYQLQISSEKDFEKILLDTGWVESCESTNVHIEEIELFSCSKYFVKVRVCDEVEATLFSEPVMFVTAILKHSEWKADYITAEYPVDKEESKGTYVRNQFVVTQKIKEAYVCATALGLYHCYLNGVKVGTDELTPGWTSYHKHLCYQTYEVTQLLQRGVNTVGAMLGAGWYKGKMGFLHFRNNYGDLTAFLFQLIIRYEDGTEEIQVSNEAWQGQDSPVRFSEIYDGEYYDARAEVIDWNKNQTELHINTKEWRPVKKVDYPKEVLFAQAGSRVKIMEELPALKVFQTPKKETVIDFGQNLTGFVKFRVKGDQGTLIRLRCFEVLDSMGNVYTENLRSAKQEIQYICKDSTEVEYRPFFTFQGFRYVQVLSWPSEVEKDDFIAAVVYSEMDKTGEFCCSNKLVNQLHHNIMWSLKGNFVDIPTDCPQRDERMGWTGDAQIFCRTASYLRNTTQFFKKWLKDVAADQTSEGGIPHVVPDIISGKEQNDWLLSQGTHSAAAWADVVVMNPWNLYLMYGDKEILFNQYESMKKWIEFMKNHAEDDIWNYKLQFGDWVALDAREGSFFGATPNDLTCTAFYANSTMLFAKIANILEKYEDAQQYHALYTRIKDKFQRTFFTSKGSMTVMTQTAHIIALYFNLIPMKHRKKTIENLIQLLKKENGHLVTGFVGTPYFCHLLSQNGHVKEAYDLLLKDDFPSWLYQVKMGATTIWEHWDGRKPDGTMWSPQMNSFNHYAYGAIGEWLYRVVLGIEVDEDKPGFQNIIISPKTGDAFEFAEGSYESLYGTIKVRWEKVEENRRFLDVSIPHNTTATICLEKGAILEQAEGLVFHEEQGDQKANCGSGKWSVTYYCINTNLQAPMSKTDERSEVHKENAKRK